MGSGTGAWKLGVCGLGGASGGLVCKARVHEGSGGDPAGVSLTGGQPQLGIL